MNSYEAKKPDHLEQHRGRGTSEEDYHTCVEDLYMRAREFKVAMRSVIRPIRIATTCLGASQVQAGATLTPGPWNTSPCHDHTTAQWRSQ
jgi:hypothetical protein